MKDTARNAIPNNGTMNITGFPCYQLYVTKSLFLTEEKEVNHVVGFGREWQFSLPRPTRGAIHRAPTIDNILTLEFRRAWRG